MRKITYAFLFMVCHFLTTLLAQPTVGLLSIDKDKIAEGYNLFFPHNQADVFLLDNCGELVHSWVDESATYRPGNMVYLTEEGNLLKCKRFFNATMDPIWAGGGGEIVELRDWDNKLLWSFTQKDSLKRLHHDVALLPNGHVLMIAWELKTLEESLQAGRDPASLLQNKLWPDYILEYAPELDSIVWEWHVWDHLIQDIDVEKDNYGKVNDHPELVDINWNPNDSHPDWMHSNAIDYNPELDQILLCVPHFDEVWIIDHSTTTEEAKGHTGGKSGKGGDLLFRWGNPATYKRTGQQQLFFPHDARWVDDFLTADAPHYGAISVFNNRVTDTYSTVDIFRPAYDETTANYQLTTEGDFLPKEFELTVLHPDTFPLFSAGLSSMQVLPNNNLLVLAGRVGRVFELTIPTNEVVWEYTIPLKAGKPVEQGTVLDLANNITFRFTRYPTAYPAFLDKTLTPQGVLELNGINDCGLRTPTVDIDWTTKVLVYPNPTTNRLTIYTGTTALQEAILYTMEGRYLQTFSLSAPTSTVDVSFLESGVYFLEVGGSTKKIVIL